MENRGKARASNSSPALYHCSILLCAQLSEYCGLPAQHQTLGLRHCPVLTQQRVKEKSLKARSLLGKMSGIGWQTLFLLLGLVLSILNKVAPQACPAQCSCSGSTVDCHGLALRTVPRNIPRNTERL